MENEREEKLEELARSFDSIFEGADINDVKDIVTSFDRVLNDMKRLVEYYKLNGYELESIILDPIVDELHEIIKHSEAYNLLNE